MLNLNCNASSFLSKTRKPLGGISCNIGFTYLKFLEKDSFENVYQLKYVLYKF